MESTPYRVSDAPYGTATIIRARCLEVTTELKKVMHGHKGSYNPHSPIPFFSAFDAAGKHLGTWSPGYPSSGWDLFEGGSEPGQATCDLFTLKRLAGERLPISLNRWNNLMAGKRIEVPSGAAGAVL